MKFLRIDGLRRQRGRGGLEEAAGEVEDDSPQDEVPEVRGVCHQQGGDRGLDEAADDVGGEHHSLSGQAVGPYAADREGDDTGQG